MKNLFIILVILLTSCKGVECDYSTYQKQHTEDSLQIIKLVTEKDSINKAYLDCELRSSTKDQRIRSIADTLFLYKARVANVRKYLNICLKNPTQDKFLKGWVRRALE